MITALELDDILASMTLEQANAIRGRLPPGFADQAHAATVELEAQAEAICDRPGATAQLPACAVDDWIRLGLLDAFVTFAAGQAKTCKHSPTLTTPQPVWSAAWKPNLVVCSQCVHLLRIARHSPVDKTCDCCGRVTTGPENSDGIIPLIVAIRFVRIPRRLMWGLCARLRAGGSLIDRPMTTQ
jgi:hypothetical protein